MIIIREKSYAENEEKKGMSTGAKVGLGALGTLAAGAGAFAAARNGLLGKTLMTKSNLAWGKLGNRIGNNMVNSASSKLGLATYQEPQKLLT